MSSQKIEKEKERKKEKISYAEGSGMPFTHPATAQRKGVVLVVGLSSCMPRLVESSLWCGM